MNGKTMSRRALLKAMSVGAVGAALFSDLPGVMGRALAQTPDAAAPAETKPWFTLGMMPDDVMDNQLLFLLGLTYTGQADIGECLDTAVRIQATIAADGLTAWQREWIKTASRLSAVAEASEKAGHPLSAGEAYMRASTYYRGALMHHPDHTAPEVAQTAQKALDTFVRGAELQKWPVEAVRIPYEDTTLPGYFWRSPVAAEKAPLLIGFQGRDASPEDMVWLAEACLKRGYHYLAFAGPGQGAVIRIQGLPFRHDWEKVVTPVVDFALEQPGVDPGRVALMGLSMGGYLAPRAVAFEKRIKLCIADPGYLNWYDTVAGVLQQMAPDLMALLDADPKAFDAAAGQMLQADPGMAWGFSDLAWKHGVKTPAEMLHVLRDYNNEGNVDKISCRMLVMDGEAEWIGPGQPKKLYDALKSPKDYMLFTAEDTGLLHCQTGAYGVATQRLFDWFDANI